MTTDKIIKELGIEESGDTFKAQMIAKILATADLRFASVVDDIMTDVERQEFEEFSKDREPQDIAMWIEQKYEGTGEIYSAIVASIVSDLKGKTT